MDTMPGTIFRQYLQSQLNEHGYILFQDYPRQCSTPPPSPAQIYHFYESTLSQNYHILCHIVCELADLLCIRFETLEQIKSGKLYVCLDQEAEMQIIKLRACTMLAVYDRKFILKEIVQRLPTPKSVRQNVSRNRNKISEVTESCSQEKQIEMKKASDKYGQGKLETASTKNGLNHKPPANSLKQKQELVSVKADKKKELSKKPESKGRKILLESDEQADRLQRIVEARGLFSETVIKKTETIPLKDSAVASPFSKGAQGIYVENDSDRQEMDGSLHSKHLQATNTVSSDDEEAELNVRMKAKLRQKTGQNVFPKLSCATTQPKPNDVQSKKVVQSNQSNSQSTLFGYFGSK